MALMPMIHEMHSFEIFLLMLYTQILQESDIPSDTRPRVEEDFITPSDDCPLRDSASQKIPKLTVKVRVIYFL